MSRMFHECPAMWLMEHRSDLTSERAALRVRSPCSSTIGHVLMALRTKHLTGVRRDDENCR